jgi:hypothetical protein
MDDRARRNSPDSRRINMNQRYEVEEWTKSLRCSAAWLRFACETVGDSAEAVRTFLQARRGKDGSLPARAQSRMPPNVAAYFGVAGSELFFS